MKEILSNIQFKTEPSHQGFELNLLNEFMVPNDKNQSYRINLKSFFHLIQYFTIYSINQNDLKLLC